MPKQRIISMTALVMSLSLIWNCAGRCDRQAAQAQLYDWYQANLDRWPLPYEILELDTRFGRTHVIASGAPEAPPLIMLHAMGLNATQYAPNVAALSQHYWVYCLDTIGDIGRSVVGADFPRNGEEYATWLVDVLDALDIESARVAGSSMGGWLAHCLAYYNPDRVDQLILLAPAAGIPPRVVWGRILFSMLIWPTEKNLHKITRNILGGGRGADQWTDYMLLAARCARGKISRPTKFDDDQLRLMAVPTLLIVGANEVIYPSVDKVIGRGQDLVPKFQARIVPEAGHLVNVDQPEIVNESILEFLGEQPL